MSRGTRVHVIGAGGGGSHVASWLGRIKIPATIWDPQKFEVENLRTAAAGLGDIGNYKADALAARVTQDTGTTMTACCEKVGISVHMTGVAFLCVDSMEDRLSIVQMLSRDERCPWIIEGRMQQRYGIIHAFDPRIESKLKTWHHYWYPDSESGGVAACGRASDIGPLGGIMGGLMVHCYQEWLAAADEKSLSELPNQIRIDLQKWTIEAFHW